MHWLRRVTDDPAIVAGIAVGLIGLAAVVALSRLTTVRPINNPLPLALSIGHLLNGLLYFDWQAPLQRLIFAVALGVLAVLFVQVRAQEPPTASHAGRAGRIAALLNVAAAAVGRVDAIVVLLWFAIGSAMVIFIAGWTAERVFALLGRSRSTLH